MIFPLPDNSDQVFEVVLTNGQTTTVSIPWKVRFRSSVGLDSSCTTAAMKAIEPASKKETMLPGHYEALPTLRSFAKAAKLDEQKLLFQDSGTPFSASCIIAHWSCLLPSGSIKIYNLTSEIIVARIIDFSPQDDDAFLDTLEDAIEYADHNNVPYLIMGTPPNIVCSCFA